jgi:hypothetical protein
MDMLKKLIICSIIIFLSVQPLLSQNVKLIRTDCDSSRSAFVTAGYLFGFDIIADSVPNVYRFLCEIEYDNINFIQYSGWQAKHFGDNTYIFPNPQVDSISKKGTIAVVALLSEPNENKYYNNPNVIHFDFVVAQDAKHNSKTIFTVKNIKIYLNSNGLDSLVDIKPVTYTYTTHGYIEIWPGDANNDGNVDNSDFYSITNLLGQGSAIKSSKSFKREPTSTLWIAQTVLAWDSTAAAYADCDGNGDVTPLDMLIVFLNFNKSHIVTKLAVPVTKDPEIKNMVFVDYPKATRLVPIYITTPKPIIAAVANLSYNKLLQSSGLLGVSKGGLFDKDYSEIFLDDHPDCSYINVITGTKDNTRKSLGSGVLFNFVVPYDYPNSFDNYFQAIDITGITENGEIIKLDILTQVSEALNSTLGEIYLFNIDGKIIFKDNTEDLFDGKISIYNLVGDCIIFDQNFVKSGKETQIEMPIKIPTGLYFAIIKNHLKTLALPFSVIK